MQKNNTYYIDGLLRQANAAYARKYLGLGSDDAVTFGYVTQTIPLWNDVRIPMSSVRPGVNAPTAQPFQPTGVGSVQAYRFNNAVTQRLEFELQLPHGLNESAIYGARLHVHWACGLASPAATVGWYVDATVADLGGAYGAPITYGPAALAPTGAFVHMMTPIHTFTGLHESAVIVGNIYRDSADAYAGNDVFGLSLDAHYAFQKAGSLLETGD